MDRETDEQQCTPVHGYDCTICMRREMGSLSCKTVRKGKGLFNASFMSAVELPDGDVIVVHQADRQASEVAFWG